MKKILMIRGISAYDVLGRAADEICEGFRKCGYQVDMIGATEPGMHLSSSVSRQSCPLCIRHQERHPRSDPEIFRRYFIRRLIIY